MITGILLGIYIAGLIGTLFITCADLDGRLSVIDWLGDIGTCFIWPVLIVVMLLEANAHEPKDPA